MASHVFHEIYLHFNWHTKLNQRLLTPELEPVVHGILKNRCGSTKGVHLHEVGGTEDHVHLAINIEPYVTISDLVKDLKGFSSHETNQQRRCKALEWQRGYGVVSFGKRQLPWVVDYVRNQKQHHSGGRVFERLELANEDEGEILDC